MGDSVYLFPGGGAMGDSITFGSPVQGGYRNRLYQLLTDADYAVDFIGTQTGSSVGSLPDSDHEGHTHIIVSNLMEGGELQNTAIQTEFNPFVEACVDAHAALGRQVSFLDRRSAVPLSDLPDDRRG